MRYYDPDLVTKWAWRYAFTAVFALGCVGVWLAR